MLNKTFSNLIDSIRLLFRREKESYLCFYKILGFYPHDIHIYEQALLHKSSSVKSDQGRLMNNERLEFLGMPSWMPLLAISFTGSLKENGKVS